MTRAAFALALVVAGGVAAADPAPPPPYKVYWSFPNDDVTAIDVDNPDLGGSKWEDDVPKFAVDMLKCNLKRSKLLAEHKDETPVREIRVDKLDAGGNVQSTSRCVMTLKDWRKRIGKDVVYRLDDELDAHASFLMPERLPGMPAKSKLAPDDDEKKK
ncbi:MAG TPA: hypothetical protein VF334_10345 [Polyangia bacterium]